jgi:hypothetical protein
MNFSRLTRTRNEDGLIAANSSAPYSGEYALTRALVYTCSPSPVEDTQKFIYFVKNLERQWLVAGTAFSDRGIRRLGIGGQQSGGSCCR